MIHFQQDLPRFLTTPYIGSILASFIPTSLVPTTASIPLTTATPTTATPTQTPVTNFAACVYWDQLLAYEFEIYGIEGWVSDGGSSLQTQEPGCGALACWQWVAATSTTSAYVHFYLPITIKAGCVERAIVSADGPTISCSAQELPIRRFIEERTTQRTWPTLLPMTEEGRESLISIYGNVTDDTPHSISQ